MDDMDSRTHQRAGGPRWQRAGDGAQAGREPVGAPQVAERQDQAAAQPRAGRAHKAGGRVWGAGILLSLALVLLAGAGCTSALADEATEQTPGVITPDLHATAVAFFETAVPLQETAVAVWATATAPQPTPEPAGEFIRFTFQECAGTPGLDEQVCGTLLRTFELYRELGAPVEVDGTGAVSVERMLPDVRSN